jgi:hypothetical protein
MKKGKLFPVAPEGSIGVSYKYPPNRFRVEATGEFRPPKRGEWYISGAIPEAYLAPNDLTVSYHIGVLVSGEVVKTFIVTGRHLCRMREEEK